MGTDQSPKQLLDLGTDGGVLVFQECLHQFTISANHDLGEALEPSSLRDGGISVEPPGKTLQIFDRYMTLSNPAGEVLDNRAWDFLTPDFGHRRRNRPRVLFRDGCLPHAFSLRASAARQFQ